MFLKFYLLIACSHKCNGCTGDSETCNVCSHGSRNSGACDCPLGTYDNGVEAEC